MEDINWKHIIISSSLNAMNVHPHSFNNVSEVGQSQSWSEYKKKKICIYFSVACFRFLTLNKNKLFTNCSKQIKVKKIKTPFLKIQLLGCRISREMWDNANSASYLNQKKFSDPEKLIL